MYAYGERFTVFYGEVAIGVIWKPKTYFTGTKLLHDYIDGLVQDCRNSIANALELLQYCAKPSIWSTQFWWDNRSKHEYNKSHASIKCQWI